VEELAIREGALALVLHGHCCHRTGVFKGRGCNRPYKEMQISNETETGAPPVYDGRTARIAEVENENRLTHSMPQAP
jgi:hypothetical protein